MMLPQMTNGSSSARIPINNFTAYEKHVQQILAVTFSAVGILFTLVTFYWFARMKRQFRHQLIMLLITCDVFKAVWLFVPAVLTLAHGRPLSRGFCQISGFWLAVGLEASDFAVLLIAIHTVLSVLRHRKITRESGLFSFRYQALASWAIFALLLPASAFIGANDNAYVFQGTFCYLPIRPIWYRIALSWGPRYLIVATILVIYVSIYIYTKATFGKFSTDVSSNHPTSNEQKSSGASSGAREAQARAPENGHDSVVPTEQEESAQVDAVKSFSPLRMAPNSLPGEYHLSRPKGHNGPASLDGERNEPSSSNMTSPALPNQHSRSDPLATDKAYRTPTLLEALRDRSLSALAINKSRNDASMLLHSRHKDIQRQLRYMFVYPMIYIVMWFPPFVNHCYFYTKTHHSPFSLNTIGVIFLLLQCTVDCLVFSIREKPWRYAARAETRARAQNQTVSGNVNNMELRTWVPEGGALAQDQMTRSNDTPTLMPQSSHSPRRERFWWDEEEN